MLSAREGSKVGQKRNRKEAKKLIPIWRLVSPTSLLTQVRLLEYASGIARSRLNSFTKGGVV